MPDDRDLLNEVANLWDGKVGSTAGITSIQRLTEVIVFDFYWLRG